VHDETLNLQQAAAFLQMAPEALPCETRIGEIPERHTELQMQGAQSGPLSGPVRSSARP
jgi:hypothetical protein